MDLTGFEAYQQEDSYKFHGAKTRTTNVRINGKIAENPNHPSIVTLNILNQ